LENNCHCTLAPTKPENLHSNRMCSLEVTITPIGQRINWRT
jgi:hypothetical protein